MNPEVITPDGCGLWKLVSNIFERHQIRKEDTNLLRLERSIKFKVVARQQPELQHLATARSSLLYPESIPGSGLGQEASGCPHEREQPWGRERQNFQWWRWNIQGWRWRQAFMDRWWIRNKSRGIMGPWLISADPKGTTISWLVL